MTTKKQIETVNGITYVKTRCLSDTDCRKTAARISAEMKEDREGREKWGKPWVAWTKTGRGKKPLTLIWPGDMEKAKAVIDHLYHPEESALIIAALTP